MTVVLNQIDRSVGLKLCEAFSSLLSPLLLRDHLAVKGRKGGEHGGTFEDRVNAVGPGDNFDLIFSLVSELFDQSI